MGLIFDKLSRVITVESPDTDITCQELLNECRDFEDELENLEMPSICTASGKEDLGAGKQVGITLKLLDWKVKFEDRLSTPWTLCEIAGGNLIRYNTISGTYDSPVEPSAYVTVSLTTDVSATISESQIEEELAYAGQITIDTINGFPGTTWPCGTLAEPVNNLAEAKIIADQYNIKRFYVIGPLTLTEALEGYGFESQNIYYGQLDLNSVDIINCYFNYFQVSGIQNDPSHFEHCLIGNVYNADGYIVDCGLLGTLILASGTNLTISKTISMLPGDVSPVLDCNDYPVNINVRAYSGDLKIVNYTHSGSNAEIEFVSGKLILDSTNTAGEIHARGIFEKDDQSNGTTVVYEGRSLTEPDKDSLATKGDVWGAG